MAEIGVHPRRAMHLLGHTDAKLTMSVYQQVLDLGSEGVASLEKLVGCSAEEAVVRLSGRDVLGPQ